MGRKSQTKRTRRPSSEIKAAAASLAKKIIPLVKRAQRLEKQSRHRLCSSDEQFANKSSALRPSEKKCDVYRQGASDGRFGRPYVMSHRGARRMAYRKGYEEGSRQRAIFDYLRHRLDLKTNSEVVMFAVNDLFQQLVRLDRPQNI